MIAGYRLYCQKFCKALITRYLTQVSYQNRLLTSDTRLR